MGVLDFLKKKNAERILPDKRLEKTRQALQKKEKALKGKEALVKHAEFLEKELVRYKEYEQEVNKNIEQWKNAEKIFEQEHKGIEDKKKALRDKESVLKKREDAVVAHFEELKLRENEFVRKELALHTAEESVRERVARLEAKKLHVEEDILARQRMLMTVKKDLTSAEGEKEEIDHGKREVLALIEKDEQLKNDVKERETSLAVRERELSAKIKAFEREQVQKVADVERRIYLDEKKAQDKVESIFKEGHAAEIEIVALDKKIHAQNESIAELEAKHRDLEQKTKEKIDIEKERVLLQEKRQEVQAILEKGNAVKREISEREASVLKREHELDSQIKTFTREQERMATGVERRLAKEERDAQTLLKEITRQTNTGRQELSSLRQTIDAQQITLVDIEAKRDDLEAKIKEKLGQIVSLKKEIVNVEHSLQEFEGKQQELDTAKNDLKRRERHWESTVSAVREKLQEKEKKLLQKEREVSSTESALIAQEKRVDKKVADLVYLEERKHDAVVIITQRKKLEADLRKKEEQQMRALETVEIETLKMRRMKAQVQEKEGEIEAKRKLIETQMKEILKKEQGLVAQQVVLTEGRDELERERLLLREEVEKRKKDLIRTQKERDETITDLKTELDLMRKEQQLIKSHVEKDLVLLNAKEEEISGGIAELEKDRVRLEQDEQVIVEKLREFERRKRSMKDFEARENKIVSLERENAETAEMLKKLSEEFGKVEQLHHEVERLSKEKKALHGWISKQGLDMPEEIMRSSVEPKIGVGKEVQYPEELLKKLADKVKTVKGKSERAVKQEKSSVAKTVPEIEIRTVLDDAKNKITEGRLNDAKILVGKAEELLRKVKNDAAKRSFAYDVRDLKASIKLAALA